MNDNLVKSGTVPLTGQKNLKIAVLGSRDHEGQMCGRAFEILGVEPLFIDPSNPQLPTAPDPDIVLISREWSVDLRRAAIDGRRRSIPVVYIMDGVIEWDYLWHNWGFVKPEGTVLQPLIASDLCVIGQHPARILAALGLADRIHVVGLPRLDAIRRRRIIERDQPRRLMIATAKTFGHNTGHKVYVRAALRDLKNWFDDHHELRPIWRIAPELAFELSVEPSVGGTLTETLEAACGLISFTSTVLLEGMLVGIPTAQIDYRAVPQYVQTAWEIRSAEHIGGVIQELLFPPAEKLAFQEMVLRDELELGESSARLADVIRLAIATNPVERAINAEAHSIGGQLDFRQIHSHLSAFAVSPMSRLQYELDATYRLWERDQKRLHEAQNKLDGLYDQIGSLHQDRWINFFRRLRTVPGFRKTGRLLSQFTSER